MNEPNDMDWDADLTAPVDNSIEAKRERAAAAYPEHLTDTMGRQHRNIAREAILRGDWDGGSVVKDA